VLLEALGGEVAIITTSQTGIRDTVADDKEGLLIDSGDTPALAAALTRLSREPELRRRLASGGRMRYESTFRPERLVRDLASVLAL
jgi:glycosyltransferase involved in cell wall biosynthesis